MGIIHYSVPRTVPGKWQVFNKYLNCGRCSINVEQLVELICPLVDVAPYQIEHLQILHQLELNLESSPAVSKFPACSKAKPASNMTIYVIRIQTHPLPSWPSVHFISWMTILSHFVFSCTGGLIDGYQQRVVHLCETPASHLYPLEQPALDPVQEACGCLSQLNGLPEFSLGVRSKLAPYG